MPVSEKSVLYGYKAKTMELCWSKLSLPKKWIKRDKTSATSYMNHILSTVKSEALTRPRLCLMHASARALINYTREEHSINWRTVYLNFLGELYCQKLSLPVELVVSIFSPAFIIRDLELQ